jgi:hypothetical protein
VVTQLHFKDAILNDLADRANVAQFISYDPQCQQRFARIRGSVPNQIFGGVEEGVAKLLLQAPERSINVRSFHPEQPQGNEFLYGVANLSEAMGAINRLTTQGLFVIANETVDVNDGGVSGVAHGGVMEFAPGGTPRVVESAGVASLPREIGEKLLRLVYGFGFELNAWGAARVEFSLHPVRRGYRNEHIIVWELQETATVPTAPILTWPNRFSEMLGDKAFGLLVAASLGLRVPHSTLISRSFRPFEFGSSTGSDVLWLRTCPATPEPGLFPTIRGWVDPFKLMQGTSGSEKISSVLIQNEVPAKYSGAVLTSANAKVIVEGVAGFGDELMLGRIEPTRLPDAVVDSVLQIHSALVSRIGSVRAEWVFDGSEAWILQVQPEAALSEGMTIVPGSPEQEVEFDVADGLSGLRELVNLLTNRNVGVKLKGRVGVTSHIADVLRRNRIPSRIVP